MRFPIFQSQILYVGSKHNILYIDTHLCMHIYMSSGKISYAQFIYNLVLTVIHTISLVIDQYIKTDRSD